MDAIYEQRVCRSKIAPQFFYHISRDKIENVRSGSKADKIAEHMQLFVESDSGMWSNIGHFPNPISAQDFSSGFSNPKFDKIKAYLGRFGYDNFRREFYSKLGREANILAASLDQIVDARNAIAHGDPNATKTPLEIANMIEVAKYFCRTVDGLFSRWCSENMCRIR